MRLSLSLVLSYMVRDCVHTSYVIDGSPLNSSKEYNIGLFVKGLDFRLRMANNVLNLDISRYFE